MNDLFIALNLFPEDVSSKDSEAMFQLAHHFAAAHFRLERRLRAPHGVCPVVNRIPHCPKALNPCGSMMCIAPVFNAAKTIADCFKFRNKIGLDAALEALPGGWTQRRVTVDALWHHATIDRVSDVIRRYGESVTT